MNGNTMQGNCQNGRSMRNSSCPLCRNKNNHCNAHSLMNELQKLDFVLYETILYLDAYPYCNEALEYYHSVLHQRELVVAELERNGIPVSAYRNTSHSSWDWISSPWPWELSAN